jgi:hypothetical protein
MKIKHLAKKFFKSTYYYMKNLVKVNPVIAKTVLINPVVNLD